MSGGDKKLLAPQQLVDCKADQSMRKGCSGGNPMTAYQVIGSLGGIEPESAYPYRAQDQQCKFDKSKVVITASNAQKVGSRNEGQMKQYVSSTGPLSICHDAASWSSYRGGIMTSCKSGGGHCTQIVGYGTEGGQSYWKVRNSWGSSFGENGHLRLIYGKSLWHHSAAKHSESHSSRAYAATRANTWANTRASTAADTATDTTASTNSAALYAVLILERCGCMWSSR